MVSPGCAYCQVKRGVVEVVHRVKGGRETHRLMLCPKHRDEFHAMIDALHGMN